MSKKKNRKKRGGGFFPILITLLSVVAIVLLAAIFFDSRSGNRETTDEIVVHIENTGEPNYVDTTEKSGTALSVDVDSFFTPSPTPEPTATPEPTPEPTQEPVEGFEYLPVVKRGSAQNDWICITVDDCFQLDNLKTICQLAVNANGKLTIFPIGENILRNNMEMAETLKLAVFTYGFEIENHTYSHQRIFRLEEDEMCREVYKQSMALNYALGVNYHQHFFRFMGGDGEYDQRSHNYLKQLGFYGVAHWSFTGSEAEIDEIKDTLSPGMIYLFHTTDKDTAALREFIPYAVEQGYELVTLNQMMGYEENTWDEVSTEEIKAAAKTVPAAQDYEMEYIDQKEGDYSWSVVLIQRRLNELGYLSDSAKTATEDNVADGVYGSGTAAAVKKFQAAAGLTVDGIATVETQTALFAEDAPKND